MSWERIRGHDAVREAFAQAVRRDRLAHAYLFVGPPGVGKRLFAQELAQTLLCEGRPAERFEACGQCSGCRLAEAGTHPDLFTVARPAESLELPIDLVRELCQGLSFKPVRGRGKVAILDDADDLNDAAANCFLKTLEEPPPGSRLILIGTTPERQLDTIVSRCQVIRFAPLPGPLVAELLAGHGVEDAALAARLVPLSGGSPGQALALADPALWAFRRGLLQGLSRSRPDSVGLAREFVRFAEEAGKDAAAQRRRAALVLRLLIDFLRTALRVGLGAAAAAGDDGPLLQELAARLDADRLLEMLQRCLEADLQIERRVQLTLVLEALLDALGQVAAGPAARA